MTARLKGLLRFLSAMNIIHDLQQMQCNAGTAQTTDLSTDLQKTAADRGFVICDNPASGNCMFYALSQQLESVKRINISHTELRKDLVQFLGTFPNLVSQWSSILVQLS